MEGIKSELFSFLKWIVLTLIIGAAVGLIMSGFAFLISVVTSFRLAHMWMLLLLPAAGCVIVFLYHRFGHEVDHGTNTVIEAVRENAPMPYEQGLLVLAP